MEARLKKFFATWFSAMSSDQVSKRAVAIYAYLGVLIVAALIVLSLFPPAS